MKTSSTVIVLGKGPTRDRLEHYRSTFPDHELWTLNNFMGDGEDGLLLDLDWRNESDTHFDVHHDKRFHSYAEEFGEQLQNFFISPFLSPTHPRMHPFPLHQIFNAFGFAYFESSFDYMLAMIAFSNWSQPHKRRRYACLCLPGCDMSDPTHFTYRFGSHFWLGILVAQGVRLELPRHSWQLKRRADQRVLETDHEFPHAYGQPWDVTEPHAETYHWN